MGGSYAVPHASWGVRVFGKTSARRFGLRPLNGCRLGPDNLPASVTQFVCVRLPGPDWSTRLSREGNLDASLVADERDLTIQPHRNLHWFPNR
jgi:hypothetical protein